MCQQWNSFNFLGVKEEISICSHVLKLHHNYKSESKHILLNKFRCDSWKLKPLLVKMPFTKCCLEQSAEHRLRSLKINCKIWVRNFLKSYERMRQKNAPLATINIYTHIQRYASDGTMFVRNNVCKADIQHPNVYIT